MVQLVGVGPKYWRCKSKVSSQYNITLINWMMISQSQSRFDGVWFLWERWKERNEGLSSLCFADVLCQISTDVTPSRNPFLYLSHCRYNNFLMVSHCSRIAAQASDQVVVSRGTGAFRLQTRYHPTGSRHGLVWWYMVKWKSHGFKTIQKLSYLCHLCLIKVIRVQGSL